MISKISGIQSISMPNKMIKSNTYNSGPVCFGKAITDSFKKANEALELPEAISALYEKMSKSSTKKAEVNLSRKNLIFVELDNMKLKMEKAVVDGKRKIITYFTHKTNNSDGLSCDGCWKMTSENLDEAISRLKEDSFIEDLEKMSRKLNEEPEYMDMRG